MDNINTLRAHLRRLQVSDLENMLLLETDPDIMKFTPSRVPLTKEKITERLHNQIQKQKDLDPFGIWIAEDKQTNAFIGWFMLMPKESNSLELGFMVIKQMWGRGYASEISNALIDYSLAKGIKKIKATTDSDNTKSQKILSKLGFIYTNSIDGLYFYELFERSH